MYKVVPRRATPRTRQLCAAADKICGFEMGEKGDLDAAAGEAEVPGGGPLIDVTNPAAVERRIRRNIMIFVAVAVAAAAVLANLKFVLGLILGCGLALLNYNWLQASLRGILAAGYEKAPPGTTMKFIFRWLVVAAAAYFAYRTGYFDPVAILAGLFAPAPAIIIEAAYVTYKTLAQDGER